MDVAGVALLDKYGSVFTQGWPPETVLQQLNDGHDSRVPRGG